ncbi:MAG TPA: FAD-dependent thymidylate synthase [Candidatus Woesebacteria bacterium]|nr:FAD-dependent thymidylate synthase [Candidatus Woesebacteria bacterium]
MARKAELKVYLIGHTTDPEKVVAVAVRRCYSGLPTTELIEKIDDKKAKEMISMVQGIGHTSTVEHASFCFGVEGLSRAAAQQLTRHRHASFSMQSQRYKEVNNLAVAIPEAIENNSEARELYLALVENSEKTYKELIQRGIKLEDARGVLPMNCETALVFTMNARELTDTFFRERLCMRAQQEIRDLAIGMAVLVRGVAPNIFNNIGPTCKTQGICWEGEKSCGLWRAIEGGEVRVRQRHNFNSNYRGPLSFIDQE